MKNGFTLIEAVVAVFVLSVGILGAVIMFPAGLNAMKYSQKETSSALIAQGKIEQILALSYDNINIGEADGVRVSYVDPANNMQETQNDTGVKKIEATVNGVKISTLTSKR